MKKRRKRKVKSIPLTVGIDPKLWRYDSAQDAISQNVSLLAQLIQTGEQIQQEHQTAQSDDGIKEA